MKNLWQKAAGQALLGRHGKITKKIVAATDFRCKRNWGITVINGKQCHDLPTRSGYRGQPCHFKQDHLEPMEPLAESCR